MATTMKTTEVNQTFYRFLLVVIIMSICCYTKLVELKCKEYPLKNKSDLQVYCTIPALINVINFSSISINRTFQLTVQCTQKNATSQVGIGTFQQFFHLNSLTISQCHFEELPEKVFQGLTHLQSLSITGSPNFKHNLRLPFEVSSDLQLLISLKLEMLDINTIPETLWKNLYNINYLSFNANQIDDLNWLNSLANQTTNLTTLDISHNLLTTLSPYSFQSLPSLLNLRLECNFVQVINQDSFLGLNSLTTLTMKQNHLTELDTCVFQNQSQLQVLDVSYNNISTLLTENYNSLHQLKFLDLAFNNIRFLNSSKMPFKYLANLQRLVLSHNNISFLPEEVFQGLKTVTRLSLSYNDLSNVSAKTFLPVVNSVEMLDISKANLNSLEILRNFSKLKFLDVQQNVLRNLWPDYFKKCQHTLETVILTDTSLLGIVQANQKWGENAVFANFSKLKYLHLYSNIIDRFDYFMIPDSLTQLDIGGNRINLLEDRLSVRSKKRITSLSVSSNYFQYFDSQSFSHSLKELKCSFCNVSTIRTGTFGHLLQLKFINFYTSKISKIERYAFSASASKPTVTPTVYFNKKLCRTTETAIASNVQFLSFRNPNLKRKYTCQITTYCKSRSTENRNNTENANELKYIEFATLDCGNNNLTTFSVTFDNSSIINTLYIDGNYLNSLRNGTFNNYTTLQYLYVNNSGLVSLESGVFFGLDELRELYLHDNEIQILHFNQFINLNMLFFLSLQNNKIKSIDYKVFKGITQLKTLHLDNNLLHTLYGLEFHEPRALQTLTLTNNNMTDLGKNSFLKLDHLKYLHLEFNSLTRFSPRFLAGAKQLVKLFLNDNNFTSIHEHTFAVTLKLEELHLQGNLIDEIRPTAFLKLMRLKKLHLQKNKLSSIDNSWFQDMHELVELYLNDNNLTNIQDGAFKGATNLKQLCVHNNNMTVIDTDALGQLKYLYNLSLHNNKLTSLAVWKLPLNLELVTLRGNEFICDCNFLVPFRNWVIGPGGSNKVTDIDDVICKHVNGSRAVLPILQYTQKYCDARLSALVISLISAGCFITVIMISVLAYTHRLEMQVWLYSRYGLRFFYKNNDADIGKTYDGFVSYSSNDEVFVAENLVPGLEPEFRLCLHDRDFPVGAYIIDTVCEVVEKSCRTLLILSNNFLNSEWCRFEFKIAHHQMIKDRCCRVIVILMEDINENELDKELKIYLKTNTYLRWGDRFFWEKLKFAMPEVQNIQVDERQPLLNYLP